MEGERRNVYAAPQMMFGIRRNPKMKIYGVVNALKMYCCIADNTWYDLLYEKISDKVTALFI